MDVKPQRRGRTRSTRDENMIPAAPKVVKENASKPTGLKAAAKRSAFADVSNSRALPQQRVGKENVKAVEVVVEKQQKTAAISKPAQRPTGLRATTRHNVQQTSTAPGQRPIAQPATRRGKTSVYQDKRPSPKKASPKVNRNAVRKHTQPARQTTKRALTRETSSIARIIKEDEPVYSDQQPHLFDRKYIDEDGAQPDEDDLTEPEDEVAKIPEVDAVSDYDTEEDNEDYTDYHRVTAGDNTTGATTQVLIPKWTAKAKKELEYLSTKFSAYDEEDEGDISMVAEYGEEIFEYMRTLEIKLLPDGSYMDKQSEIQWSMRSILMDWLVQVHQRFNLLPETLFLTQNYIDRFLSNKVVSLGKLQLVGATALFVAAKYEEVNCPSVHEIVYMVDGGYTAEEILKAERFMLSMLQFELGWPGPMSFLRRISKADDYDLETRTLAKYFLEVTVMDERFVASPPSFLAAGAHCLARHMLDKGEWTPSHTFYSGYTASQLEPLIQTLVECCENAQEHHKAIFDKYTDRRYKRASIYVAKWIDSQTYDDAE
ncbi:A/B/D/E cyclin [Ascodesmis nigricans]|uniref:A/B/D/E cyclin n=1 Tax=Ascodesmis nigricans TaxID=341454 RepID=A0A4S2MVD3_9PEZI|nr:A/B/D/E cyclin [Ascodesmis nigricans]